MPVTTPLAHFKLNDNAGNTTVTNEIATLGSGTLTNAGNTSAVTVAGKINSAFHLDGGDDWISIADHASLDFAGSYSIAFWFNLDGGSKYQYVYSRQQGSGTNPNMFLRFLTDNKLQFYTHDNTTSFAVTSTTAFSTGTWYHIVVVSDTVNDTAKIYVNNVEDGSGANTTGSFTTDKVFAIGVDHAASGSYLDGRLDDFRIYSVALSGTERSAIYNGGSGTEETSPGLSSASSSLSLSPSASQSPSSSLSLSPSSSVSASPSEGSSESLSISQSPSISESSSISVSPSISPSRSPSRSFSSSISPSQPPGSGLYSKQTSSSLPNDNADLSIFYGEDDETAVSSDDGIRVSIEGDSNYLIHQFKVVNTNGTDSIKVQVNLQSSLAPTISPVYLQVWKVSSSQWEIVDTDDSSLVNTDFDLKAVISTNQKNYYDTNYEVSFRVYQLRV